MDGRDLARCLALEAANDTLAYCVSLENGAAYGSRHLHANFNRKSFPNEIKKRWGNDIQFRQIILDYFWIPRGSWVMTHWSRTFFRDTLVGFVTEGLIDFCSDPNCRPGCKPNAQSTSGYGGGVVYLPFCFHCLKEVVAASKILSKYYSISFLYKSQLREHALWAATSSILPNVMQNWLGKAIDQEEIYCTFSTAEVRNAADDAFVRKDDILEILHGIEDFDQVRMIKLKVLEKFNPNSSLTNYKEKGGFVGLKSPGDVLNGFGSKRGGKLPFVASVGSKLGKDRRRKGDDSKKKKPGAVLVTKPKRGPGRPRRIVPLKEPVGEKGVASESLLGSGTSCTIIPSPQSSRAEVKVSDDESAVSAEKEIVVTVKIGADEDKGVGALQSKPKAIEDGEAMVVSMNDNEEHTMEASHDPLSDTKEVCISSPHHSVSPLRSEVVESDETSDDLPTDESGRHGSLHAANTGGAEQSEVQSKGNIDVNASSDRAVVEDDSEGEGRVKSQVVIEERKKNNLMGIGMSLSSEFSPQQDIVVSDAESTEDVSTIITDTSRNKQSLGAGVCCDRPPAGEADKARKSRDNSSITLRVSDQVKAIIHGNRDKKTMESENKCRASLLPPPLPLWLASLAETEIGENFHSSVIGDACRVQIPSVLSTKLKNRKTLSTFRKVGVSPPWPPSANGKNVEASLLQKEKVPLDEPMVDCLTLCTPKKTYRRDLTMKVENSKSKEKKNENGGQGKKINRLCNDQLLFHSAPRYLSSSQQPSLKEKPMKYQESSLREKKRVKEVLHESQLSSSALKSSLSDQISLEKGESTNEAPTAKVNVEEEALSNRKSSRKRHVTSYLTYEQTSDNKILQLGSPRMSAWMRQKKMKVSPSSLQDVTDDKPNNERSRMREIIKALDVDTSRGRGPNIVTLPTRHSPNHACSNYASPMSTGVIFPDFFNGMRKPATCLGDSSVPQLKREWTDAQLYQKVTVQKEKIDKKHKGAGRKKSKTKPHQSGEMLISDAGDPLFIIGGKRRKHRTSGRGDTVVKLEVPSGVVMWSPDWLQYRYFLWKALLKEPDPLLRKKMKKRVYDVYQFKESSLHSLDEEDLYLPEPPKRNEEINGIRTVTPNIDDGSCDEQTPYRPTDSEENILLLPEDQGISSQSFPSAVAVPKEKQLFPTQPVLRTSFCLLQMSPYIEQRS